MSKTIKYILCLAGVLIFAAIVILTRPRQRTLTSTNPEYVAIENTLRTYLEIDAEAQYTIDDSRLVEVLANDRRGGLVGGDELNARYLKSVRWFKGNPRLRGDQIGYLDVKQALYAFRRQAKQIYDEAVAQGRLTAPSVEQIMASYDPGDLGRPTEIDLTYVASMDLNSLPEFKAMLNEAGYDGVMLPHPRPEQIVPESFVIQSIKTQGDLAYVRGDFSYATVDLIFAKMHGSWFLIGERVIRRHAG